MQRLGHYDVHDRLGKGGMGVVYRATDLRTSEQVALKLLHAEFEQDESRRARFLREAQYAQAVQHSGVVKILDAGEVHVNAGRRTLFLAMELVRGRELSSLIARETPRQRWVAEIGLVLARALVALDTVGVVHRDIKPQNVLVTSAGEIKLMDFGLAVLTKDGAACVQPTSVLEPVLVQSAGLTQFGSVVGTPGYAAPEQLRGGPVDGRADLYALGATLYQMLSGALPYSGGSPREVLAAIEKAHRGADRSAGGERSAGSAIVSRLTAAVPGVSVRLAQLVGALMSDLPGQRPQEAQHVEAALVSILDEDPDLDRALDDPEPGNAGGTSAWMRLKDWLDA